VAQASGAVVVDPWPIVRLGIGRVVAGLSYRILGEAGTASEAVGQLRRLSPRLCLVGAHLEGDAAGVVEVAKDVGARVVAMVHRPGREELAALAGAGADAILEASVGPAELRGAVERVMKGQRVLAPSLATVLVGLVHSERPPGAMLDLLTARERQVLACLVEGAANDEIARRLFLSGATVKTHLNHIYAKLEVRNRQEAMARAIQLGLVG